MENLFFKKTTKDYKKDVLLSTATGKTAIGKRSIDKTAITKKHLLS